MVGNSRKIQLLLPFVITGILLLVPKPMLGSTTGRLRGAVVDPDGLAVPGVTVTIHSEVLMGGSRTAVTGGTGAYRFTALPPGVYSTEASLDGFEPSKHEAVKVAINATADADFVLQPAEFTEEMIVTGHAPLVDVSSSSMTTDFTSKFLQDLPTSRSHIDLMSVSPGVSVNIADGWHLNAFGSDVGSNNWLADGIEISVPETGSRLTGFNPDTIEEIQVMGVGAPAEFGQLQGAVLNVVTKRGSNRVRGSLNAYWFNDSLVDSEIDFDQSEFSEYEQVDPFSDVSASLGGPIREDRLWYFVAYENLQDASASPGQDPAKVSSDRFDRYDARLSARIDDRNLLDFRVGTEQFAGPLGFDAYTEPSAAEEQHGDTPYWGLNYQAIFSDRTFMEVRYSGWRADLDGLSQTGSTEPAYIDFSPPDGGPTRYFGGKWWPWIWETGSDQFSSTVSHFADDFLGGDHDFKFGVQISRGDGTTTVSPSATGGYYVHGGDIYYQVEGSPYYYGNEQEAWGVFVDDSWAVTGRLTLNVGLRFDHAEGIIPSYPILEAGGDPTGTTAPGLDPAFTWDNWSPRVGFAYRVSAAGKTVVRGAVGVYYDGILGAAFNSPPPYTPTMFFSTGPSWNGPWDFQGVWFNEELTTSVDPDLRAPRTQQYSLGFEREFRSVYSFGAQIVYKDSKDGIGWEILDDGVYETIDWTDPFTGQQYTLLDPTVFPTIRKGNGPGFTVEGQLDRYWAEYKGLVLTFNRRFADWWGLQASYVYSESRGLNPAALRDTQWATFLGKLGSHPNQWLNLANGQQQIADRPHMFRVQGNWILPWNLHASTVVNLQNGRPYTRQARAGYQVISGQQTNFIAAPAGGPRRFDFQNLIDFSIGKRWQLSGRFMLKTDLQVLNLLNSTAVDQWVDYVLDEGDEFVPSSWVKPRRLMLRVGLEY